MATDRHNAEPQPAPETAAAVPAVPAAPPRPPRTSRVRMMRQYDLVERVKAYNPDTDEDVNTTLAHHLAYVAVDGIDGAWSFPNAPAHYRDEQKFIANIFDDLKSRYGFTADKTVIGGFSLGASMAWYTACKQGNRAAAMVTFSGVFWDPLPAPTDCIADLPPIVHFHGTADQTFPLHGRAIGTRYHQGDAFKSVAILRERAGCDAADTRKVTLDGISCDDVPGCIRGDSILCIHGGGHEARSDFLDAGLTAVGYSK